MEFKRDYERQACDLLGFRVDSERLGNPPRPLNSDSSELGGGFVELKCPSLNAAPPRAGGREGAASALLGYYYYSRATPNEPFHVSPAWRMLMLQRHQVMPTEQGTAH